MRSAGPGLRNSHALRRPQGDGYNSARFESGHEKNANATSAAMIDAIAVANAEVHADFR